MCCGQPTAATRTPTSVTRRPAYRRSLTALPLHRAPIPVLRDRAGHADPRNGLKTIELGVRHVLPAGALSDRRTDGTDGDCGRVTPHQSSRSMEPEGPTPPAFWRPQKGGLTLSIAQTRALLREWGRWAGGTVVRGYPTMSAFVNPRTGAGRTSCEVPEDVLEINGIIRRAESRMRRILLVHYCGRHGTAREKAVEIGISKSTYWERLSEAEWWVHTETERGSYAPMADRTFVRYANCES